MLSSAQRKILVNRLYQKIFFCSDTRAEEILRESLIWAGSAHAKKVDDMKNFLVTLSFGAALCMTAAVHAQTAATITATCKDGTTFSGTKKSGACKGHHGVQAWTTPGASPATTPATPATATTAPAAPVTTPSTPAAPPAKTQAAAPPPPSAAGQVWVNTASHVYHCPGSEWYGKTKAGEYMSEANAKTAGNHADHGKACS
jgi:hypothetical protein